MAGRQKKQQRPSAPQLDISAPRSTRRAGKWTALLLTCFILALIYLGYTLISKAPSYMAKSGKTTYGKVLDRDGDVLFDGSQPLTNYPPGQFADIGNLIGDTSGQMSNTIVAKHLEELANYSFTYGNEAGDATIHTTLSHRANKTVYNAFGDKNGAAIAYNWKTGEILVCVSRPCVDIAQGYANLESMPSGSLLCKAFFPTVPGSTQKVSTLIAAYEAAGVTGVNALEYTCEGSWINPNGDAINCHQAYGHGTQNLQQAFENSCNPYFAQLVQSGIAPLSSIIGTYTRMGYAVNGQKADAMDLDGITINPASTKLSDLNNFETEWGALGQGKTLVSPYQLMLWQGAIANGTGSAVRPYLVKSRTTPTGENVELAVQRQTPQMFSAQAAQAVKEVETLNSTHHYYVSFDVYSCGCKSGTAQVNDGGREYENSLLAGFCLDDRAPVAFCILIEERQSWDITTAQLARILLDAVSGIS